MKIPTVVKAAIDGWRMPLRQADGKRSPVVSVGDIVIADGAKREIVAVVELGGITKLMLKA
jgi:hypothetical protein